MPIISPIGRKSPKTRLLIALIYATLIIGGATMVYPFLLMISGSFKSDVDRQQWDVFPRYLCDDPALFRKFAQAKYNDSLPAANSTYKMRCFSFEQISPPAAIHEQAVADWKTFLAGRPLREDFQILGLLFEFGAGPKNLRFLKQHLQSKTGGDLAAFNTRYGTSYERWNDLTPSRHPTWVERWGDRHYQFIGEPLGPMYREFRQTRPQYEFFPVSLDGDFLERQIYPRFGKFKIEPLNQAYGTNLTSFSEICLPARRPVNPAFARDWEQYVRTLLHPRFIRVEAVAKPAYEAFLRQKYQSIAAMNTIYGTHHRDWSEAPLPGEVRDVGVRLGDFTQFIEATAPIDAIVLTGAEFEYRDFLRSRYGGDLGALRRAHGIDCTGFDTAPIPAHECDWLEMQAHRTEVKSEFVRRNYAVVLDYVILHGRALWNTVIFCALSILTALIINPLAAYALSRYQLPSQYKVLFFLMATMAFPAEVTLIPGFLLLKELSLLNTFWALILPGAANGYAIFLLKGFFDSLPRELYESAQIDGANEWTMFWGITMSLSKPILAVIALGAFTAAYGAFMFALIVCQDERMWTIMVYLYQLQQQYSQPVVFASLLVAALPTLLVFVFCQNIIMRGIVVPVEK
ncbi:MAG: carbohydrate ABC transporter permease [Verrucomicrobia bacterium]|nr:carbohydrate ABC transporter permease [Verrucomicrobiota bacterium]